MPQTLAVLTALLFFNFCSLCAQPVVLDPQKHASILNRPDGDVYNLFTKLDSTLLKTNDYVYEKYIQDLEHFGKSNGPYFWARLRCLKANQLYFREIYNNSPAIPQKKEVRNLLREAMNEAYKSEDDRLIAFVSPYYGQISYKIGDLARAVMYSKNGVDLSEKLKLKLDPYDYQFVAETLFKVEEYNTSIGYARKAVAAWRSAPVEDKRLTVSCMNTVGLCYHRMGRYDSALFHYNKALDYAKRSNELVWAGIVMGNIGQLFFAQQKYDTAYSLLMADYRSSRAAGVYDDAANALQWASRVSLATGYNTRARDEAREAFQLLKLQPDPAYLRNIYFTLTQIFRQTGEYDSAFYYNTNYLTLNSAIEKMINTSSLEISKTRLNDEISRYNIQNLNREKRAELLTRNIIIGGILVSFLLTMFFLNRGRIREKYKMELVRTENLLMETEVNSARSQLKMFTQNLKEKTALVDKLQTQVTKKQIFADQQTLIEELSRQTILTEEDWINFKNLFDKIYPTFFVKLRDRVRDITNSERRMAALIKLHLSTREVAGILGISPNSVNKTKQRLRQRMNLGAETNLDEVIAEI